MLRKSAELLDALWNGPASTEEERDDSFAVGDEICWRKARQRLSITEVEDSLRRWVRNLKLYKPETPQKLAIPLENLYTEQELSFAGLRGKDRVVADLLQNCGKERTVLNEGYDSLLEVHLCFLTKYQLRKVVGGYDDLWRYSTCYGSHELYSDESSPENADDNWECYDEGYFRWKLVENFETSHWIDTQDQSVIFERNGIEVDSEVVKTHQDEDYFHGIAVVDGHEEDRECCKVAMIVVWPKFRNTHIRCNESFSRALDEVEVKIHEKSPEALRNLRELVDFQVKAWKKELPHYAASSCYTHEIFSRRDNGAWTARLLSLLRSDGDSWDVLRVLKALRARTILVRESRASGPGKTRTMSEFHGILTVDVAKQIASAVQRDGWEAYSSVIKQLLVQPKFVEQAECFAMLALYLQSRGCNAAAFAVAKKTLTLLSSEGKVYKKFQTSGVVAIWAMIFCFVELFNWSKLVYLDLLNVTTTTLCYVFVNIKRMFTTSIVPGDDPSAGEPSVLLNQDSQRFGMFLTLCQAITKRDDFLSPTQSSKFYSKWSCYGRLRTSSEIIEDIFLAFIWLQDGELLKLVVDRLMELELRSQGQTNLKVILESESVWQNTTSTRSGRSAMRTLVSQRLSQLPDLPEPVFTWCQPDARIPGNQNVEDFLKGPLQTYVCRGFQSLSEARTFRYSYFNGTACQIGYKAEGREGGRGKRAYCKIWKTREIFDETFKAWECNHTELASLRHRIEKAALFDYEFSSKLERVQDFRKTRYELLLEEERNRVNRPVPRNIESQGVKAVSVIEDISSEIKEEKEDEDHQTIRNPERRDSSPSPTVKKQRKDGQD